VPSPTPAAILFDLYGTLVKAASRPLSRRLPQALGVARASWTAVLKDGLLTRPFSGDEDFARFLAEALVPERADGGADVCLELLRAERGSVSVVPGARSLLAFLKRRGVKLGLVSNLASPFREVVRTLGLEPAFDAVAYSCDEGVSKPDSRIYRLVLERLAVAPEDALFVGDNGPNDVRAPAALGFRTAGVGVAGGDATLTSVAALGLLDLSQTPYRKRIPEGLSVSVGGEEARVESVTPVADGDQGRYNLVYRLDAVRPDGMPATLFAKRFLLPETVHVEEFAYRLQALTGLPCCSAAILPGGAEPLLLVTAAPGLKFDGRLTESVARGLGAHLVFAYLFSNADVRPRNAFVAAETVRLVDLEHCFFNLAIDTSGLACPDRPETFDRMPAGELAARVKKTVLTPRATRRARREFFGDTAPGSALDTAYREGWISFYAAQKARAREILEALRERVHAEPPLVIGTQGYRRAMAEVDVDDVRARLDLDPEAALAATW
jgi:HAD superfamily hydrolase (TIGR01549 family)